MNGEHDCHHDLIFNMCSRHAWTLLLLSNMYYLIYSTTDSPMRTLSSPSLAVSVSFLILSLLILVNGCLAHIHVCTMYMLVHAHKGQGVWWISGIGVTESANCRVGAGNGTRSSGRSASVVNHWAVSLAPNTSTFKIQTKSKAWGYCCNSFEFNSEGLELVF